MKNKLLLLLPVLLLTSCSDISSTTTPTSSSSQSSESSNSSTSSSSSSSDDREYLEESVARTALYSLRENSHNVHIESLVNIYQVDSYSIDLRQEISKDLSFSYDEVEEGYIEKGYRESGYRRYADLDKETHEPIENTEQVYDYPTMQIYEDRESGLAYSEEITLDNEVIKRIADKHNVTPSQVVIRWHIDRGLVVLPRSKNPIHIKENFDVEKFSLDEEDMKLMKSLNINIRTGGDPEQYK